MDRSLRQSQAFITDEGSKPEILSRIAQTGQQHWQFGMTGAFFSIPRDNWCAPLSHPSSCILVNHGPSQQSCKEEHSHKLRKWGATTRYYASHTKTMSPRGSLCQDPAGSQTTQRPDHHKETQTAVVWTCLLSIRSGQNHLARHSERGKTQKKRWEDSIREWTGLAFAKS